MKIILHYLLLLNIIIESYSFQLLSINQPIKLHCTNDNEVFVKYKLNVSSTVDKLVSSYPYLLTNSFDDTIYRDDIVLYDPIQQISTSKKIYVLIFMILRSITKIFLSDVLLKASLLQSTEIIFRWQLKFRLKFFLSVNSQKDYIIDAHSLYYIDDNGLIYKHLIYNLNINGIYQNPPYLKNINTKLCILMNKLIKFLKINCNKFKKFIFKHACEDTLDCSYPFKCCDYIIIKICCKNDSKTWNPRKPILAPIPVKSDIEENYLTYINVS